MELSTINQHTEQTIEFPEYQHGITQKVSQVFTRFFTNIYDTFFDGNEPWKFEKYQRNLQCIAKKLGNHPTLIEDFKNEIATSQPNDLRICAQKLLNLLQKSLPQKSTNSSLFEQRQIFRDFTLTLRQALKSASYQSQKNTPRATWSKAALLIQKICNYRFTSVHLYPFCEKLVSQMIKTGMLELAKTDVKYLDYAGWDPIDLPFEIQFNAIQAAPQSLKGNYLGLAKNFISGATGLYYDPHLGSNMPYLAYSFHLNNRAIQVIRMGTPTIEYVLPPAHINPEFEAFVSHQNVLYISLQNQATTKYGVGNENQRNKALCELSQHSQHHFTFCCFSNDSDWYHQKNIYQSIESIEDFKTFFLKTLSQPTYHFDAKIPLSESILRQLLNETIEELFDIAPEQNNLSLTLKSRRVCIEIFHTKLALYLLEQSQAHKFLIVCKDGKDRAGKDNALMFLYLTILEKGYLPTLSIRVAKVYLHAVSLIVKKNTMNFRKKRFLEAFEYLNLPEVQTRIAKKNQNTLIREITIISEDPPESQD